MKADAAAVAALAERAIRGERRALARLLSLLETGGPSASIAIAPKSGPTVTPAAQENRSVPTVEMICPGSTISQAWATQTE